MSAKSKKIYEFQGFTYEFLDDDDTGEVEQSKNYPANTISHAEMFSNDFYNFSHNPLTYDRFWTEYENRQFWEKYKKYLPHVGPQKKFITKKKMWDKIATELGTKTSIQCGQYYHRTLTKWKKDKAATNEVNISNPMPTEVGDWTEEETNFLISKYEEYFPQIGPFHMFRNTTEMWDKIAQELKNKSSLECKNFYIFINTSKRQREENDQQNIPDPMIEYNSNLDETKELDEFPDPTSLLSNRLSLEQPPSITSESSTQLEGGENWSNSSTTQTQVRVYGKCEWTNEESDLLMNKYITYTCQIGPLQTFPNKSKMWDRIAAELGNKSSSQCKDRYYSIRKKYNFKTEQVISNPFELNLDDAADEPDKMNEPENLIEPIYEPSNESSPRIDPFLNDVDDVVYNPPTQFTNWNESETELFINKCTKYKRKFRNKRKMLKRIATELGNKSLAQCKQHYNTNISPRKQEDSEYYPNLLCEAVFDQTITNGVYNEEPEEEHEKTTQSDGFIKPPDQLITNKSSKILRVWSEKQTKLLFDKCKDYLPQIGPFLKFNNRKDMWRQIATELGDKTLDQCESHYYRTVRNNKGEASPMVISNNMEIEVKNECESTQELDYFTETNYQNEPKNSQTTVGAWSEEETKLLIEKYTEYLPLTGPYLKFSNRGQMWKTIGSEMGNRSLVQCQQHYYKILKGKSDKIRDSEQRTEWSERENTILMEKYEEYLPQIGNLKKFRNTSDMWKKIATDLGNKSNVQCRRHHYYLTVVKEQNASNENNYTNDEVTDLITIEPVKIELDDEV